MKVLYLSYDGMLEPLGQPPVLAYLNRLAADRPIYLISFEKADDWANVAERKRLARYISASGIVGHPQLYHKRTTAIATAWDIASGMPAWACGWRCAISCASCMRAAMRRR